MNMEPMFGRCGSNALPQGGRAALLRPNVRDKSDGFLKQRTTPAHGG